MGKANAECGDEMLNKTSLDEEQRLKALAEYDIMNSEPEPEFDRLAFVASRLMRTPVALITLVDRDRQYFKARVGTELCETPREVSFCAHALAGPEILVVTDATKDGRFSQNPLVTGSPGIRFYAGAPLLTHEGHVIGTLCAIDFAPRSDVSEGDLRALKELADLTMLQMEARRLKRLPAKMQKVVQNLSESEDRFRLLVQSITDYAIYMIDLDGIVTNWNAGAERFKGYRSEEIVGRHFDCFYTQEDREAGAPQRAMEAARVEGRFESEGWRVRKDGSRFWANAILDPVRNEDGAIIGFAKITRDITERRRNEQHLRHLAHNDSLTNLPNRHALLKMLDEVLRAQQPLTLLMVDLDGFKNVNDMLGHAAGDALLKNVADRMTARAEAADVVGRLGGDEFLFLRRGTSDPVMAASLCGSLIDDFRTPFKWEGRDVRLGLTIGIATTATANSTEQLLVDADLALRKAKADTYREYMLFEPTLRQESEARRDCEARLRRAVERDEFELFLQPQVRLSDRRLVGAEALLRWNHPERGMIGPGAFLDVLERSSLASIVGDWAISTACGIARQVRDLGLSEFRIGVNLFSAQFQLGRLAPVVLEALKRHALPPQALELEITENTILGEDPEILGALMSLRQCGVGIAFDDYGTGYASLSLLKRFPLSRLKIDQSFVRDLVCNPEDQAVVKAIVYLANSYGLEVIAEGIETEQQERELAGMGCRHGQGFLYGQPMSVHKFLRLAGQSDRTSSTVSSSDHHGAAL